MVATGWWPPHVEFDEFDMATVVDVITKQNRAMERASRAR